MRFTLFPLALAAATLPLSAAAQEADSDWTVEPRTSECILSSPERSGTPMVQLLRTTYGLNDFAVTLAQPLERSMPEGSVVVQVGDFSQPMELTMAGQRLITSGYDWDAFYAAFRSADRLDIVVSGEVHDSVPLAGSGAGIALQDDCLANAYDGPVAPPAAPPIAPPIRTSPVRHDGYVQVTPLNRQDWITAADWPESMRHMQGRVRITLSVGADGRVTTCDIVGSSGHGELDDLTCALVQERAYFRPATDREGRSIASTYTTMAIFELP